MAGKLDPDKLYSYFNDNHGPLTRSSKGWYEGMCPYCHSRKLVVHLDYAYVKCWKNCFPAGFAPIFVKNYLSCSYFDAYTILEEATPGLRIRDYMDTSPVRRDIVLPEGYKRILDGKSPFARGARNYLIGRGFDLNYLDMIGVGYSDDDDYFGYIIIPFKKDGSIVYFIGRDFMNRGNKYRYKNPPQEEFGVGKSEVLFNEEALYMYDKIYLMEGWADAASIGNNALSIQGKSLSPFQWDIIKSSPVKEVVVISDLGAEMEALEMLEQLYKSKKTKLIKLTQFKDLGKDVNAIGADKVLAIESQTPYITTLADFYHEARSLNTRKKKLLN